MHQQPHTYTLGIQILVGGALGSDRSTGRPSPAAHKHGTLGMELGSYDSFILKNTCPGVVAATDRGNLGLKQTN